MEKNMYLFLEYQLIFSLVGIGYWLIKKQLAATTKRFTLLSLPLISLMFLWFNHSSFLVTNYVTAIVNLDPVTVTPDFKNSSEETSTALWFTLALIIPPISAIIYRFVKLIVNLKKVNFLQRESYFIGTYGTHSYSFFNRIVLELGLGQEEENTILEHEKIHCKLKHSVDVILYELYAIMLWINPLYHLLKTDLKMTHEQEVDAFMFEKHGTSYINLLLNKTFGTSSISYVLTNQFYDASKLKKRILIMKEKSKNRWALLLIIPVLGVSAALVSFKDTDIKEEVAKEIVLGDQFQNASFKGGMPALIEYFQKNIKYPKKAEKDNIQGKVMVGFTVNKDGSIDDVTIKKSENNIFDAEALRVVKSMPNWNPATKDGKAVTSQMVLPIQFKL